MCVCVSSSSSLPKYESLGTIQQSHTSRGKNDVRIQFSHQTFHCFSTYFLYIYEITFRPTSQACFSADLMLARFAVVRIVLALVLDYSCCSALMPLKGGQS